MFFPINYVIKGLNEIVADLGSQKNAANLIGISESYLSDVLHKRRAPGPKILDFLGLEAILVYGLKKEVEHA